MNLCICCHILLQYQPRVHIFVSLCYQCSINLWPSVVSVQYICEPASKAHITIDIIPIPPKILDSLGKVLFLDIIIREIMRIGTGIYLRHCFWYKNQSTLTMVYQYNYKEFC